MKQICLLTGWLLLAAASPPRQAFADYYLYYDHTGTPTMTNNLASVPARYRATMKVVKEEKPATKAASATPESGPAESPARPEQSAPQQIVAVEQPAPWFSAMAKRHFWFAPLLLLIGIALLIPLLRRICRLLPSPLLSRLIYLSFLVGLLVFCTKYYADYLTNSYLTVKSRMMGMLASVNTRQAAESGGQEAKRAPWPKADQGGREE
jgi:hypothetical protein